MYYPFFGNRGGTGGTAGGVRDPTIHQGFHPFQTPQPNQPAPVTNMNHTELQPPYSYRQQLLREYVRYTNDFNRNINQYIQAATSVLDFYHEELSNTTREDYQREQRELTDRGERRTPLRGSMRVTSNSSSVRRADRRDREIERRQIGVASPTTPTVRLREERHTDIPQRPAPISPRTLLPPQQPLLTSPPLPPTTQHVTRDPVNDLLTNELGTLIDRVFGNIIAPNTHATRVRDDVAPLDVFRWDIPLNFNGLWNTGTMQPARPTIPSFQDISAALMPVELVDFTDPDTPDDEHLDPIDLRAFTAEDSIVQIRGCGHRFRRETIMNAFRYDARCPVCRRDIRDSDMTQATRQITTYPAQEQVHQPVTQTTPLPTSDVPTTVVAQTTSSSRPPTPVPPGIPRFTGIEIYDRSGNETPSTPSTVTSDDDDDGRVVEQLNGIQ